ncbi:MAG: hypothetical protein WB526_03165 [Candidatus Cybelea sp.]
MSCKGSLWSLHSITRRANGRPWTTATRGHLPEGEFPLIAFADGKRYELYSDGTFDEVEL